MIDKAKGIVVEKDGKTAKRGSNYGIVLIEYPLEPNKLYKIKFLLVNDNSHSIGIAIRDNDYHQKDLLNKQNTYCLANQYKKLYKGTNELKKLNMQFDAGDQLKMIINTKIGEIQFTGNTKALEGAVISGIDFTSKVYYPACCLADSDVIEILSGKVIDLL